MIDKSILNEIGLSPNESEIYLILLKMGEASVYEMANYSRISRPNIYDILKTLSEKGLVTSIIRDGKKLYISVAPEKLIEMLKEKEANLLSIIPKLNELYINKFKKPLIEIFEGAEGLKKIMNEMLKEKEILIFNGVSKEYILSKIPNFNLDKSLNEKKRLKIKTKMLYSEGIEPVKGEGYSLKKLPGENLGCVSYWVYGDRVGIGIWSEPLIIIRIIDEDVAKTYRRSINLVWNSIN